MAERDCPYCGATVADARGEIAHMETVHPNVLRERGVEPSPLARARAEGTSGPTMQQLVDALTRGESEVESLRRQLAGAVSLDDPKLIETLARVIENRHGTLQGIGSTLREALAELKRGQ